MERFPFSLHVEQDYILKATSPKMSATELLLHIKLRLPTAAVYNKFRLEKDTKGHDIEKRKYLNHNSVDVHSEIYEYLTSLDLYAYHFGDKRTFEEFLDVYIQKTRMVTNSIHRIALLRELVFQTEYKNAIPHDHKGESWVQFIQTFHNTVKGFANYSTIDTPSQHKPTNHSHIQPLCNPNPTSKTTTNYPRNISGLTCKTESINTYQLYGGDFLETIDEHVPNQSSQIMQFPGSLYIAGTSPRCLKPPFGLSPRCPCVGHDNSHECECPCWCHCACKGDIKIGQYCETCDPQRNIYIHQVTTRKTDNPTKSIPNTSITPDIPLTPHTHTDEEIKSSLTALKHSPAIVIPPKPKQVITQRTALSNIDAFKSVLESSSLRNCQQHFNQPNIPTTAATIPNTVSLSIPTHMHNNSTYADRRRQQHAVLLLLQDYLRIISIQRKDSMCQGETRSGNTMSLGAQTSPLDDNSDYLLTKLANKFSSAHLVTWKTLRRLCDKSDTRKGLKTCTHLQCIGTCIDRVCAHSILDVIKCVNDYRYLIGYIIGKIAAMIFLTPQQYVHQIRAYHTDDHEGSNHVLLHIFSYIKESFIPLQRHIENYLKRKLRHNPILFKLIIAYLPKPYPSYNGTGLLSLQENIINTPFTAKQIPGAMQILHLLFPCHTSAEQT
jgi:hypothetical protein